MSKESNEFNDNVSEFTRDFQAKYLLKLREGIPERKAAREVGFEPKTVMQYRKEAPLFEEECQEALLEAEEEVQFEVRRAALRGEPWAGRSYASKWGWSDKKEEKSTNVNIFNGAALSGNPLERIMAMQKAVTERPTEELPPPFIDVSLADEDEVN